MAIHFALLEIRRAVFSVSFLVAVMAAAAVGLVGMLPELEYGPTQGALYLFRSFYSSGLGLLAPLLATLPFSHSYAVERNSDFSKAVMLRMPPLRYATVKLAVSALAGGLVLVIPVIAVLAWATATYPIVPDVNGLPRLFGNILASSPSSYMSTMVALAFIFGATFAVVGLASSVFFRSAYYAHIIPLALYLVPAFFLGSVGLGYLDPPMMWEPANHVGTTPLTVVSQYAVFFVTGAVVFLAFLRVREE